MSLSLSTLAALMTMRRRSDDPGQDPALAAYAKQVAPMIVVSLLTAGGIQLGPMGEGVSDGRDEIKRLTIQVTQLSSDLRHVTERIDEVSTRRTAQVGELEKRILSCELNQARHAGQAKP